MATDMDDDIRRIPIIDAHHHLWDLDRNYYPWLCDPEPFRFAMAIIRRSSATICPRIIVATALL